MTFRSGRVYGHQPWCWSVDRNVVSISVIGVGVAVHTYRPSAGSQKLMRGLDRRHAKTRCIQVPHLVFMVVCVAE